MRTIRVMRAVEAGTVEFSPGVLGEAAAVVDAIAAIDSGSCDARGVGGVRLVAFDAEPGAGAIVTGVGFRPIVGDAADAAVRAARDAFGNAARAPEFVAKVLWLGSVDPAEIVTEVFGNHGAAVVVERRDEPGGLLRELAGAEGATLVVAVDAIGVAAVLVEAVS